MHYRFSRLAILIKVCLTLIMGLAIYWASKVWVTSPSLAVLIFVAHLFLPLALTLCGLLMMRRINRDSPPTWTHAAHAGLSEAWALLRAGLWWQPFRWKKFGENIPQEPTAIFVFIHGFVSNRGLWYPWINELQKSRIGFVSVNLEPLFGSIDSYIHEIEAAITRIESTTNIKPILVCHSMGGLAVRKWLVSHTGACCRVAKIVTIGTPHFGTWLGNLSLAQNGQQMKIGSQWLQDLAEEERQQRPEGTYRDFVCWYSNSDNIVMPSCSAELPGADNRRLEGLGHLALVYHFEIIRSTLGDSLCTNGQGEMEARSYTSPAAKIR